MTDYYRVLGVARNASADDIHRAYRKLAKECHPDLHPGDALAAARFAAISEANDALCHLRHASPKQQEYVFTDPLRDLFCPVGKINTQREKPKPRWSWLRFWNRT